MPAETSKEANCCQEATRGLALHSVLESANSFLVALGCKCFSSSFLDQPSSREEKEEVVTILVITAAIVVELD